jgi:nucleoside-diphosphate-sugar epimerase
MENQDTVLVTGGTSFVGSHCILQLLQKGYKVKTSLRSINRKNEVIEMMKTGGITLFENLSFIEADLSKDDNWDEAMRGCQYVLHIASPTHIESKDEDQIVRPAVDGLLRVLKAARNAGVKRVVMTSSFGALGFSNKDRNTVTTEADWTNPNEKGLSAYEKSKALAERAAWNFMEKEGGSLELAVINPVAIFGPSLGPGKSPSLGLLKMILSGSAKAIPNIVLNVVDIRDVADLHIRAMTNPNANGQRFIASADGEISLPQIAILLKNKMPAISAKVSTKTLSNWVVGIASLFSAQAKQAAYFLSINRNISNAKAKKILGWKPIANKEEAVLASAESMIKFGSFK